MILRRILNRFQGIRNRLRPLRRRSRIFPLRLEALEERILLSTAQQPAILLLDPSGRQTLAVSDHGSVQAVGIAIVDSKSPSAVDVDDHGYINVGALDIAGSRGPSVSDQGKIVGAIYTGVTPQKDPLVSLGVPDAPPAVFKAQRYTGIMYPGTYENGIDISGNGSVTMEPGVYVVNGSFYVSNDARLQGSGVTIYLNPKGDDGLEVSDNAVVTLSPATSGAYEGITLFGARSSDQEIEVEDHGTLNLVGTIYAAGGRLEVEDNAVLNGGGDSADLIGSQFIGHDMQVKDNGKALLDATDFNTLSLTASLSPAPVTLSNGTLVTNTADSTIAGNTAPLATVALEIGSDSSFDDGTTTADASGNYSLPVTLAEGANTLQVRATSNGQQTTQTIQVTLDNVPPTITVTSPATGLITNQNVTITGDVTDSTSGVASLDAALDNGTFAPVSFGSNGSFSFVTTLALDGTADGPHTEHLQATDNAGNISTVDVSFTLDTVAPTITVTSPANGLVTNQNVTITGDVTDNTSGVTSLEAALDNGTFAPVSFGGNGSFSFVTTLALDGTADGLHTEHLQATDNAGNVSTFDISFTLDTTPPTVDFGLDPAFDTPPIGDGHTQFATVTLTGTTEPDIAVVLEQTGASTTSDSTGAFSFTGVALALGPNTFTVDATDQAGNTGTVQHTITRDPAFDVILTEGPQLLTTYDQTFTVPAAPSALQFTFGALNFDTSGQFIKDAFEASLTDSNGNSLVLPIAGSETAFLNISAGQAPVLSPNVQLSNGTVDVDLSHIPAGTQAQLEVRLVNNDATPDTDTNTTVGIDKAQVVAQTMNTPDAVTPAAAPAAATRSIDFPALADVSTSMTATYGQTSFNEQSGTLYTGLTVQNTGSFPVDAPLVAVIAHLSDPSIHVRGSDGVTPDGSPYFDLGGLIGGSTLAVGQSTSTRTLSFYDPNHTQFTYDLEILGQLNQPPAFTSEPNTEAIPGLPYVYQASASDPDNDALTYSLLIGPSGMAVDPTSGKVTWNPQQSDLGNETVLLQVDDGHGGTAQQQYTVSTTTAPPDQPPLFTSTPIVQANVDTAYTYQATATDPEQHPLTFSATGPTELSVDPSTGLVSWTPTASQLGISSVTLTVTDGQGGTAVQTYSIDVLDEANNEPPLIVSNPITTYTIPPAGDSPAGNVNPTGIQLTLGNGQTSTQNVSLNGLGGGVLTLGSLTQGNIGTAGEQDVYTFTLAASSLLYFDFLTDNNSLQWSLQGPAGTAVSTRSIVTLDADMPVGGSPVLALPAGAYTLTVSGSAAATGPYAFRALNLATASPITVGTTINDTLDPYFSTNLYQFTANAGDQYAFSGQTPLNMGHVAWRLIDPYGNVLFDTGIGSVSTLTLTATGTYYLLFQGPITETGTQPYSFNVQFQGNTPPNNSGTPLTLGSSVSGTLTTAGQQNAYDFSLATNSQLYFDALTNDSNLHWSLNGPPGTVVNGRLFVESDGGSAGTTPVVLPLPAGNYVLTVSSALATDAYSFRLLNLATAAPLTPGTPVQDTLSPANSTNAYQFNATAGQSFYFAGFPGDTTSAWWRLIDPYDNVLFSTFLKNDAQEAGIPLLGRLNLTATGTYTLLVEGNIAASGSLSYSVNVDPITDPTQALTLGSPVNGNLATPGEQDHYTFSLSSHALLYRYFDGLTNNANLQWTLTGPAGTVVKNTAFNVSGGGSLSPLILPAGAYTLTVSGIGQTTGGYEFRLSNLSTATQLTPGTPVSATLNPVNSTDFYQFNASAGQTFYFAHLTNSAAGWRLVDPFGNVVFKTNLSNDAGRLTLTATGSYTVLVEGAINATGTDGYSFNVIPVVDTTQPLALGNLVTGNLAVPSEQDNYTFTLSANTLLYFDSLTNNSNLEWSLTGPGGTAVNNRQFTASDSSGITNPILALPPGAYTLTVSAVGQVTGAYSFRLSNLANAAALSLGVPVSDTLNPGNSTNIYQFNALAGQAFYFAHLSGNGNALWRLIDPYGDMLFSTSVVNDRGRLTLGAAGAYTLLVEGAIGNTGAINYSFEAAPITDTTQALQLGSLVTASLATPGEHDNYTFSLSSNALLYFDALTNNSNLQWSLSGPAGAAVTNRAFTQSDAGGITNPALSLPAGAYTLTVSGVGQTAGAYSFRLSTLASAQAMTPGTSISDTLNPADSTNIYQFSANAGDQFDYVFQAASAGTSAVVRLIGPYGNLVLSTVLGFNVGPVTAPATGTYYLLVEGNIANTGTGTYTINLPFLGNVPPNPTGTPLTLGSTISGTLTTAGQQDQYVFTLANTTFTYFDALTNNGNLRWSLNGPAGSVVNNLAFTSSDGHNSPVSPVRVLPAGTYTLTVFANGQNTGSYAFRLVDLSTAAAVTLGTPVSGALNPANSTNFYQFSGNAGESLYFQLLSDSSGSFNDGWRLVDPFGNTVFDDGLRGFNGLVDAGRVTLAASGTYTLLVEGAISDTVGSTYSFNVVPITDTAQTLTLGATVTGNLAAPGQQDHYNFSLANNGLLYFDAQANTGQQWSLSGPSGLVANNVSFTSSDGTSVLNPVRVVPAGDYTLTVSAPGATTGAYTFLLSDLANLSAPKSLTLGTPTSDTLNPADSTNIYQFSGSAGQSLYFEELSSSSVQADWRLIDPYGHVLFSSALNTDGGRVNLRATGTYTLLVEGNIRETGTVHYSFNVFPLVDATQALTLGVNTSGTLLAPSEQDNYTFTLAAASRLYFDSLTNNANIQWSLVGPGGKVVNNRDFAQSDFPNLLTDPVLELPAGSYTLTVTGVGDALGAYAFQLLDLAAAAALTINTPVLGKLSPGNSTNLYQFSAQAGQAFYFTSNYIAFTLSGGSYQWRLLDPYDNVLFQTNLGSDGGLVTLPVPGTYTLLVEGAISNTSNAGYTLNVEQPGVNVVASQAGVPFTNLTGAVGSLTNPSFQVQLQGNGQAQVYDLLFESPASGNQLGSIPVSIDTQYSYQVRAVDADRDTLTYQLTQAPAGMQIDPISGLITWVPTAAQVGQNAVTVQVADGRGGVTTQNFTVTVLNTAPGGIAGTVYNDLNDAGSRTTVGNPAPPGGPFQAIGTPFPAIGSDSKPGIMITIGPGGVISSTQTGQGPYDNSDDTYVGIVNETNSGVAVESLNVTGNDTIFGFEGDGISTFAPNKVTPGTNVTGYEGPGTYFSDYSPLAPVPLNIGKVNFDDGQGNGLQPGQETYFSLEGLPTTITADIVTQVVPVTIDPALPGFTVYLDLNHDGHLDPGDPSTVTNALGHYSFSNLAPGTYTVAEVGQPGFQETQPTTGAYTAVVQSGQVTANLDFGNHQIPLTPRPPAITSTAPTTAASGQPYEYNVTVSNPDGVALQFDLPVKPDGMAIDPETGIIGWTPAQAQVGAQDVIVRMTDSRGEVVLQHFVINVSLEAPPVITSTPPSPAVSGQLYQYQVVAQNADNNPLAYTLLQGPAGMTIDSGTGLVSWVGAPLGAGLPSSFQVSLQVSDGQGGQDTQTYTLFVITSAANTNPTITSSPPKSAALGRLYLYQVVATDPNGLPLTYSLPAAPAGMTIDQSGMIRWTPTAAELGPNAVTVAVTNSQGGAAGQSFTVQTVVQPTNLPPQITSQPPLAATLANQYVYNLTGVDPENTLLIWSLDNAPDGMTIDPMQGFLRWTPTVEELGNQNVTVRLTNAEGLHVTQSFAVTVRALDVPPLITSTPPTQATVSTEYTYAVKASDVNAIPLTFTLTTGPLGMTIDSVTGEVQWLPAANETGSQNVAIAVDDGQGGQATQTWTIIVGQQPPEQPPELPPTITSTPDFDATVQVPYTYQVTATSPENVTLQYSLPLAPAGMTIDPASGLIQWTPTIGQLGQSQAFVEVADGLGGDATQSYTLTVLPPNQPPVIQSAAVTTVTAGVPYEYDVKAVDPDNDSLTYTLVTAPTGMTIDSLGRITWSPQIADIGNQPVVVSVSDGRGSTVSQSFTITVAADTEAPEVILTLSANPADIGTPVTAVVTATDDVGVTALGLTLNGNPVALDSMGSAILPDNTAGIFTLVATASDAAGNVGTDSQTLVVINPQVTNAPVVAITTPADNGMVTAPTQVIGTVQDPNLVSYTLSVAPVGSDSFTTFLTGTSQVTNGALGTFDPTMLEDGSYDLRLIATNTGGLSSEADVTVDVSGILKLGNFTVSFTDLAVPVAGIPITVTRTYDSLTANQSGDFGYGWRLEFRDTQLQTSVPSTGEEADDLFNPFQFGTHVYITPPGSPREGFTFEPTPAPGVLGGFLGILQPEFVPDPGVKDTLTVPTASLTVAPDGSALEDYSTALPYNPASPIFGNLYTLTTSSGLVYSINAFTGQIDSVTNANNDTLTFTDAGVASSSGQSISFQRDAEGRIAAIVDPTGAKMFYQYDANGNLVAVTDRSTNITQFVYLSTPAHYLGQVIDPLGRTGIRTDYDATGRLDGLTDANGNSTTISYDLAASTETVTDALGNPTTYEYDDQGNIVEQIDALGGITRRTFDANNDTLTETDPMGRTTTNTYDSRGDTLSETDALGNTSFSTFRIITFGTTNLSGIQTSAPFTRLTAETDPLGNSTSFALGGLGNYKSVTDSLGNTTTETTDPSGNPASVTEPDGSTSHFVYDANGNLLSQTDALGNTTSYTYDGNGNRLTSTTTMSAANGSLQTLTTTTQYDANGRVIAVTDPDGNVTQTQYDADGNKIQTIDPLGRVTKYVYDNMNRLIETVYPDGSTTQEQYDADGHQTASIDQLGRMTQYQYDALGRLIKAIYPDGSSAETAYDADGEVIATTDQLGRTTTYQYDVNGQQISQTDPLGNTFASTYDADGRAIAHTDPLGNTTRSGYDADGKLIETDYPDGTKTTTTYDADGRVLSKTDQLGQTTSYEYDGDGRLIMVTDPLGNKTSYTYNQLGQQVTATTTQTAADGSVRTLTTQTEYDDLGRVIAVIDPDGDITRTEYDADGNVAATIDPLGRITKYVYDSLNRLIETIYPDNTTTQLHYDAAGERIASVDELGRMTQYEYDSLGRLIKTIYADGSSADTQYDADGNVIAQTDGRGNRTQFQYDGDGRETLATDALGETTSSSSYDADGRNTSVTDGLGHRTQFVYDALNRLIETDYADGTKTTNTYDADGRLIASTDQLGRTTRYKYDADGRRSAVIDPLGHTTQYAYDEQGNLIRKIDPNGNVTTYEYDGEGRQIAILLPALPGQPSFEATTQYDADGNVVSSTDYNGNTIQFVYDARNRLITKEYPDGSFVVYSYTLTGQQATVTDSRGTTVYTYDQRDRLLSCTEPDGTIISYTYDAAGDCTAVTTPAGTTSYTFDPLGRELTVTGPDGGITTYTYDASGNVIRTVLPNGIVETRSYDGLNRLTFLQDVSGSTVIASYAYTLGPTGLIDKVFENTGRTVEYAYDALDRLTEEKIIDAIFGDRTIDYTYDPVGNRLTMNDSVGGLTTDAYDAMDRLTTSTTGGQVTNYTYDKNGNLLTETSPNDVVFYQYDFDNRLIAAGANGVTNETNQYDANGNLVSQTINGQETRLLIDTVERYAQVVMEYSPGGTITAGYVYGSSLISQTRGGSQSFYLADALGSTRDLTNAAGAVTDKYIYDAFGGIIFQSGTTVNPYLFAGQRTDPITGLDYMRARYYDAAVGRFISADPLRQVSSHDSSFQFYVYAGNNPVNHIDPSGKDFDIGSVTVALAVFSGLSVAAQTYALTGSFAKAGLAGGAAFVSALLTGGIASQLSQSFVTIVGTAAGTLGVAGGGYSLYTALTSPNATVGQKVAAGIGFLTSAILLGFGVYQGINASAAQRATATGGQNSQEQQVLADETQLTGKSIDKLTGGDVPQSNYLYTDPSTGETVLDVNAGTFPPSTSGAAVSPELSSYVNSQPADTLIIRDTLPADFAQTGLPSSGTNPLNGQVSYASNQNISVIEAYYDELAYAFPQFKKIVAITQIGNGEPTVQEITPGLQNKQFPFTMQDIQQSKVPQGESNGAGTGSG